jgi:hypothetical protein
VRALERAARAICAQVEGRDDVWDDLSAIEKSSYEKLTRSVLFAIRDLEDDDDAVALVEGRSKLPDEFMGPATIDDFSEAFTTAIDGILRDEG